MKVIIKSILTLLCMNVAFSQTTGKISGTVLSEDGTPLAGANVIIKGNATGASADENGEYRILGVTGGTYTLSASYIGYASIDIENVLVQSSLTTKLDFNLKVSSVAGQVVTVTSEKPLIQVDETSSVTNLTGQELRSAGVRDLNSILATVAGVVFQDDEIHIRGGRSNEVAYFYYTRICSTHLGIVSANLNLHFFYCFNRSIYHVISIPRIGDGCSV